MTSIFSSFIFLFAFSIGRDRTADLHSSMLSKSSQTVEYFENYLAQKNTVKKICPKAKSNLVVVNFTTSSLKVYVNNKKVGTAPAFDQKVFKEVLPVGNPIVKLLSSAAGSAAVAESVFEVKNEGKKTCKRTLPLVVR